MSLLNLKKISDMLLRFETTASQRTNFALFDTCVKLEVGLAKFLSRYVEQSSTLPQHVLGFLYVAQFRNYQPLKGDWCRKLRPHFALFDPPVKIRGVIGELFECQFVATPRT